MTHLLARIVIVVFQLGFALVVVCALSALLALLWSLMDRPRSRAPLASDQRAESQPAEPPTYWGGPMCGTPADGPAWYGAHYAGGVYRLDAVRNVYVWHERRVSVDWSDMERPE